MDSPTIQPALTSKTHCAHTLTSSINDRGAIRKRSSNDIGGSISTSQAERLFQLVTNTTDTLDQCSTTVAGVQWITPEHSPQLNGFAPSESTFGTFPQWTVPTPPRSDSGAPGVSIEEEPRLISSSGFESFNQPVASEMSSLGFLLPSQYGASPYESGQSDFNMDQSYMPPMRVSQSPITTSGPPTTYAHTTSSSPSLYQSRGPESFRRQSELPASSSSSYEPSFRRISGPYGSTSSSGYSMPARDSILSISGLTHSPLPSPHFSSTSSERLSPQYTTSLPRSPSAYDSHPYGQTYATSAPPPSQLYPTSHQQYPPSPFVGSNVGESSSKPQSGEGTIRVLSQPRPKPQCFEHGCNGRQFSTFSNLLRHQREKSGSASKSYCPKCGAEFTRTTARNGHLAHDKCTKQQRRTSEGEK